MRVSDFLELGELFAKDAFERNESCGGHFREESVEEMANKKEKQSVMMKTTHMLRLGNGIMIREKLNCIKSN
jgi:aspartate oxidase